MPDKSKAIIRGRRKKDGCEVTIDGVGSLPMQLDLFNHSPTGFEWGYMGSGPAQLALAILVYTLEDEEKAVRLYQRFKEDSVARIGSNKWRMYGQDVLDWAKEQEDD